MDGRGVMQTRIMLLLIVVVIVAGGIWFWLASRDTSPPPQTSVADTRQTAEPATPPQPTGPRHVTDDVKQQIRDRIPLTRKVVINAVPSDAEAADYANEFAKFFKDSGYTVDGPNFTITAGSRGMPR